MAVVVHKFSLRTKESVVVVTDESKFIFVDLCPDDGICLWVEMNPEARPVTRLIVVLGPGDSVPPAAEHIGSLRETTDEGSTVWHVYDAGILMQG